MTSKDDAIWAEHDANYQRLREAVTIDKFELDTALAEQPALFLDASDLHVAAADRRDFFKNRLVIELSDAAAELRASGEYKSETAIKDVADGTAMVKLCRDRLSYWTTKSNQCFALREAMDQRGKMLKELANLYVSGYYQASGAGVGGKRLEQHQYETNRGRLAEARANRPELNPTRRK